MKSKKVLIVDDDSIILDSLSKFLSQQGYVTKGVKTIANAITGLQSDTFHIVLTELNLPDGEGLELAGGTFFSLLYPPHNGHRRPLPAPPKELIMKAEECILTVKGLDALERSPIIDIKPYLPRADFIPNPRVPEWTCHGPPT